MIAVARPAGPAPMMAVEVGVAGVAAGAAADMRGAKPRRMAHGASRSTASAHMSGQESCRRCVCLSTQGHRGHTRGKTSSPAACEGQLEAWTLSHLPSCSSRRPSRLKSQKPTQSSPAQQRSPQTPGQAPPLQRRPGCQRWKRCQPMGNPRRQRPQHQCRCHQCQRLRRRSRRPRRQWLPPILHQLRRLANRPLLWPASSWMRKR